MDLRAMVKTKGSNKAGELVRDKVIKELAGYARKFVLCSIAMENHWKC